MNATTALREPENYGLRGWISAVSRSGPGTLTGAFMAVLQGADRAAFRLPAGCVGDEFKGARRHEDVDGPNRPAVAGSCGGRLGAGGDKQGGIRRIGPACGM